MTSLELLQEIDAWLSFNNSPSKKQISELRNDIKKHISEQLNMLHVSNSVEIALLERAASLVGNPGTNISGSTDMACDEWQKDYERWRNER